MVWFCNQKPIWTSGPQLHPLPASPTSPGEPPLARGRPSPSPSLHPAGPQVGTSVCALPGSSLHGGGEQPHTRQRGSAAEREGLRRATEHGHHRAADQRREGHRLLRLFSSLEVPSPPRPQLLHAVWRRNQPAAGSRLVFSSTYRPGEKELQEVIRYNNGIVETIAQGGLVDIFPWMKYLPNRSLRKLKECITIRDHLLSSKLQEHKESLTDGEPRDLLDALLKGQTSSGRGQKSHGSEGAGITDDHILMTAAEAFGAGVETTSTTLLWILAYLLHHPEVQERVQRELDEQVGAERPVSVSDRGRLPYLDCVINEGMRIRPVSPVLIPHTAMTHSSIGGYAVSRGTRVLVNMWSIHHDPRLWDKPDLFLPDRFLDDQGQRVTPACFLPFGAGPRVCVGESLARLELFLFLSSLLQRMSFRLPDGDPPPNLQGRLGVVLQPLPYKVIVTPRSGWEGGATKVGSG
nr:steroid 17-alpha-hydroxylase/17,20 lyase isoform X2 [Nothobranchius furzeri]XP_054589834.1 steroid 17-alpha-hydroxylase/17,20 lyase isoform X2 [Nothobranchius furzeri]XP_054589835.1 steroid 17-alpha-hydroxylase/17,20 lyase isoform X2 [Nothobranchius furzeri]